MLSELKLSFELSIKLNSSCLARYSILGQRTIQRTILKKFYLEEGIKVEPQKEAPKEWSTLTPCNPATAKYSV